jgi:penicillin-binding protein 1A
MSSWGPRNSGWANRQVPGRRHAVGRLLIVGLTAVSFGGGLAIGTWQHACVGNRCPSIGLLHEYQAAQALKIYAADGRLVREIGEHHRTVVSIDSIAPAVQAAFIAVEDKRFYSHNGIDYWRIAGAVWRNLLCLCYSEGFSTMTMQLARDVWPGELPKKKTLARKIREMQVALEIEQTYTKERILELYLNDVFLGGNAFGVEGGARRYFGKAAVDLNPAEAAMLAALPPGPNRYDPRRNPQRAMGRRNLVLNLMRDQGYLTPSEAERWKAYPIILSARVDFSEVAPYFTEWVRQEVQARLGDKIYEMGYRVYTTLDLEMQVAAERQLEAQLEKIEAGGYGPYYHITYQEDLETRSEPAAKREETPYLQGAVVTLDAAAGYVRAMVGGRDFSDSEWNRVTQAQRQAGSTFKPFVYTAAIRAGIPLSHIIVDGPISLPQTGDTMPWEPQNFDLEFMGPMTLRRGLRESRNLVAIKLGQELGVRAVIGEARRFGISAPLYPGHALHIGSASVTPLEMASAYTAFATLGIRAAPLGILRVEDEQGNIVWGPQVRHERIIDDEHMWLITDVLEDVVDRGTGTAVRGAGFRFPAGGKTGTTNDGTNVWFIGFTPELVTAAWIGLDRPRRIKAHAAGGTLVAPLWAAYMKEVYESRPPPAAWDRPESLFTLQIDATTGYLATPWCPRDVTVYEWFVPGTEPIEPCPVHDPLRGGIPGPGH